MADNQRGRWNLSSGLTRGEQRVLVFLIAVVAAGLGYQFYAGSWRRETLVLHQGRGVNGQVSPALPTPFGGGSRRQTPAPFDPAKDMLDLNTALVEQLESVPGIGPVRATAIVRFRETRGPFGRFEDLGLVGGIGDKTLETLRPYFKPLDGLTSGTSPTRPTTGTQPGATPPAPTPPNRAAPQSTPPARPAKVNLNTATVEELDTLDGIGPILARRIVEYRTRNGPFRTPAEIQKVHGIGKVTFINNRARLIVRDR